MKATIWFRTEEKQPANSGYYLCYQVWGIGGKRDGDNDIEYLYYYDKTGKWYGYENDPRAMHPDVRIVYYWTDANPADWVDKDIPRSKLKKLSNEHNAALEDAFKKVNEAIDQYNMIKELLR